MAARSDPTESVLDGSAWTNSFSALERAGSVVLEHSANDPLERAKGLRYLSRLTRLCLERYVEYADPLAPVVYRPVHATQEKGVDNPDSHYQQAALRGDREYVIRGHRGSIHHLGFGTYYGDYALEGRFGCGVRSPICGTSQTQPLCPSPSTEKIGAK